MPLLPLFLSSLMFPISGSSKWTINLSSWSNFRWAQRNLWPNLVDIGDARDWNGDESWTVAGASAIFPHLVWSRTCYSACRSGTTSGRHCRRWACCGARNYILEWLQNCHGRFVGNTNKRNCGLVNCVRLRYIFLARDRRRGSGSTVRCCT